MLPRDPTGDGSKYALNWRTGNKPLSLIYSLTLHGGLVALAFLPPPAGSGLEVYRSVVLDLEKNHKLIYYDFRKELPAVSPSNPTGERTTPGPNAVKSKQNIVTAPDEKPGKQLVYIPEPHVKLETEIKAPNLVAIEAPMPVPERPQPKPFQAPQETKPSPALIAPLPSAPVVAANASPNEAALNSLLNKPAAPLKQFTPPTQAGARAPTSPGALPNAPALGTANDKNSALAGLLNKPAGPVKRFTPPTRAGTAAPAAPGALPNAPALATANNQNSAVTGLLNKPAGPVKQFTAPKSAPGPAPATPAALPNAPSVTAGTSDQSASITALLKQPAGPPPKAFTPPTAAGGGAGSRPAAPSVLPNAPSVTGTVAGGGKDTESAIAGLLKTPAGPPPKAFRPPTGSGGGGGRPGAAPALPSAPALADGLPGGGKNDDAAIAGLLNAPAGQPLRPFTAPKRAASTGVSGTAPPTLPAAPPVSAGGTGSSATVAILGLNPANVPQIPKPEGSRPARIEAGTPAPGATRAELGGGNSAITIPNVSVQGGLPVAPATATRSPIDRTLEPPTGLATPQAPQVLATTPHLSVPQWPNGRFLPPPVEQHFHGRVVYMTVIPSAHAGDDWVVWFAELSANQPQGNLLVHPPVLMRAGALPPVPANSEHGTGSIRLRGVIRKDGHLGGLTELAGGPADRELVQALESWRFGPARRNGVVIDADTVIEIPVVFGKLSLR